MLTNSSNSLVSDSLADVGSQSEKAETDLVRADSSDVHGNGLERPQASQPDEKSAWFQKQQKKRGGGKAQSRPRKRKSPTSAVMIQQIAPEELSWQQKAVRWFAGFMAMGYGISLLFHIAMLILFSLFILPHAFDNRFQINATEGDTEGAEDQLVELVDTRLDFPSKKLDSLSPINLMPIPLPADDSARAIETIQQSIGEDFEGEDGGGAFPDGGKKGKNAVTKGNFTAWTVPDDPKPGESYSILIKVKVPEEVQRYNPRDLSGYVIGTDGWTTPIGFWEGGLIPQQGDYHKRKYYGHFNRKLNLFIIEIPPPEDEEALVEDTIKVRSKILKEEQTLKIVF